MKGSGMPMEKEMKKKKMPKKKMMMKPKDMMMGGKSPKSVDMGHTKRRG